MGSALLEHLDYLTPEEQRELDAHLIALTSAHTAYQRDPVGWAKDKLGIAEHTLRWSLNPGYDGHPWDGTPDPIAAMFAAIANWDDCGVESATGTGKSYGAAILLLWFLACFENALVFTFAPKEDQLKLFIWKNIGELWPRFAAHFPDAELTDLCIRMRGGLDESWAAHGYAVGIKAGETVSTKASGMHAEHMLLIYEEAAGQPAQVMEAGENASIAPHNLRLAIGNPNHRLDPLHKFCTTAGVVHIRASGLDHPNVVTGDANVIPGAVSQKANQRRLMKYGADSPVYQSRVRGESPEQAADALIRLDWLEAADQRHRARMANQTIPTRITGKGVDVANSEHGDRGAICDFAENVVVRLEAFPCPDANQLGRQVVGEARSAGLPAHRVGIDSIGVGAGTVNECRRLRLSVQALNFGASPISQAEKAPDGSPYEWAPDANRFQNLRGQTYWQLREDLQAGTFDMAKDEELWEELLTITFEDEGKVVKLMPKDDIKLLLGRSPDKSDALAMGNWVRERKIVRPEPVVADHKQPHQARKLEVKDGRVVVAPRPPRTVEELVDRAEGRQSDRLRHRERSPRRRYS